jgi:CBS domain-containing protein
MQDMTVATVMTKDPVTVAPDTAFEDIAEILGRNRISAVPVVGRDGVPVGVVSEVDLVARGRGPEDLRGSGGGRAVDLMNARVLAVDAGEAVSFAARELNRRGVRRLFVLDHGRLVGVVSRRDLLKVFLRSDEEIRVDVEREVFQRVLWADMSAVTVSVTRGVAVLEGRLDKRSEVAIAGRLTAAVPGVVEVRNRLDHLWNDHRGQP